MYIIVLILLDTLDVAQKRVVEVDVFDHARHLVPIPVFVVLCNSIRIMTRVIVERQIGRGERDAGVGCCVPDLHVCDRTGARVVDEFPCADVWCCTYLR